MSLLAKPNLSRVIKLNDSGSDSKIIQLVAEVASKDAPKTWETLTRTGKFYHPVYGDFEITKQHLNEMVANFKANTYGQKLFIDVQHKAEDGAAAEILDVKVNGNRLQVFLEWTDEGRKQVKEKGRRYLSIEYHEHYKPNEYNEAGKRPNFGAVLTGGGLVLKPHVKGMADINPHALADGSNTKPTHVVLHPHLTKKLQEENIMKKRQLLEQSLRAKGLSEAHVKNLLAAFDKQVQGKEDNTELAEALADGIESAATQLAEQLAKGGDAPIELSVNVAGASQADINSAVQIALSEAATASTAKAAADAGVVTKLTEQYTVAITGSKSLSEDEKAKVIANGVKVIGANMNADQVAAMATINLSAAEEMSAARKLSEQGFAGQAIAGAAGINQGAVQLGQRIHAITCKALGETDTFANGGLQLTEYAKLQPFTKKVLGAFDTENHQRLLAEEKQLSDGTLSDTSIPASITRQVITEIVEDHKILDLVDTVIDATSGPTAQYRYEERDSGPLNDFGIVPEGAGIPTSGVAIKIGTAYLVARKLAMKLSDELIHFNAGGQVNWDAWARTISANTQLMRDELARWISFEIQRINDALNAQAITDENIAARLDGSNSMVKLANFPLVPAFQRKDLQGNAVGNFENEIVVKFGATVIKPFPIGSKNIAAGTYYFVSNYNLGLITFLNELGQAVTPSEAAATISYSHATNVEKFDTDHAAEVEKGKHLKGLVNLIGRVKARMYQDIGIEPNFGLCAATLHEEITEADNFTAQDAQAGTNTNNMGNLDKIKSIPMYRTNTGSVLGEERLQLGVRGTTAFVLNKPFTAAGNLIDCVNSEGQPTGEKLAYGTEYSGLDTPVTSRNRYKAIIVYSATERAAL
jgi:hypothetical protein